VTTTQPKLRLRYAALSDVGRVRKDNQDSGYASENLLVIADGVGGAARGDVASSTAVQILRRLDAPPPENLLEALAGAIHRAHDRIAELVDEDPELEGTSTTVTAALFDGRRVGIGHVGDSRGYLLRNGELSQLTKDHTFVQSLIDEGRITEEESRSHPHRNLILRAVDGVHETDPDLFTIELLPGDRLLLCSDGCSGVLDNSRLTDILGTGTVDFAAVELVRAALEAGSSDNVTCVVADVVDAETPVDGETSAAAATGPMLVGAAAEQPRKPGGTARGLFRGHRNGDTGELEPVAGEELDNTPLDPEELRYAPRPPKRFLWLRRLAIALALAALLVVAAFGAYSWSQDQYYVSAHRERVAIFRGVQADLPGVTLYHVHDVSDVPMAALRSYTAAKVREGIGANDLDDAERIVENIRTDFTVPCPTPEPSPSASPRANADKGDRKTSEKPRATASPRPTSAATSETPSPSPSPTLKPPNCVEVSP
jgi:PPM family protein phosphatase